jgi:hypothetical protein
LFQFLLRGRRRLLLIHLSLLLGRKQCDARRLLCGE